MSRKISRTIIILALILTLVAVGVFGYFTGYNYVTAQNERLNKLNRLLEEEGKSPITESTPGAVEIYIPRNSDLDDITDILLVNNLIKTNLLSRCYRKLTALMANIVQGPII